MADTAPNANLLRDAALADVELLVRLHDREPDQKLLLNLARAPAQSWWALSLTSSEAAAGFSLLDDYFAQDPMDKTEVELLAVEYADIYLTFGKRVAPNESYWRTEDRIERQEPMFAVRDWYAHYGLTVPDWRIRADDHLVNELSFVAALLRDGRDHALLDAGRFLDRHLLVWSHDFFAGVVERAESAYFAGLALVSDEALKAIRQALVGLTGESPKIAEAATIKSADAAAQPFIPGLTPSW